MAWSFRSASVSRIDDIRSDDAYHADASPIIAYLWGVLITLAVILALRAWTRRKIGEDRRERMWNYVIMAILWPLFICAVLFVILWATLTRRGDH